MTNPLLLPPVPLPDPDTAPYWDALKEGRFMMARCVDTGQWFHPPLERSPYTGGEIRFEEVAGTGTVYSYIVIRQQTVPGHTPPYVTAVIELDEQPGLRLTGVVDAEADQVRVGSRVKARIVEIGESGFKAPAFVLAED